MILTRTPNPSLDRTVSPPAALQRGASTPSSCPG